MSLSMYEVLGTLSFRGHAPGVITSMTLSPDAEARAIERGNIRLLERSNPSLRPGSYALPEGWRSST